MKSREFFHYIAGYLMGGSIFLLLLPYIIYSASGFNLSLIPGFIFSNNLVQLIIALICIIPGIIFLIWSNAALFFIGKGGPAEGFGMEISPKTKHLVISGPYRYTRNPMVFGVYTMYLGLCVYLNSYVSLFLVIAFFPLIILYLKKSEEKRLMKDFGDEYIEFRRRVSILIPLPPKK